MKAPFSGYGSGRAARRASITLTAQVVDETAAAGTVVGTLGAPGPGWTFYLADTAGGRFALEAGGIVVGQTPLGQASMPHPSILVAASDGISAAAARLTIDVRRGLPALPLPVGARLAAVGDSQTAYNNATGAPISTTERAASSYAYGYIEQALALDPRFDFDSWYDPDDVTGRNLSGGNQGIFGDHMDWPQPGFGGGILGRLPAIIARRPGLILLQGGSNSLNSGDGGGVPATAAYAIAKLDAGLTLIRNAGIPTIIGTIHPRNDWPAGDPRYQALLDVNAWIRQQSSRSGIIGICDPTALLAPAGVQDASLFMGDKIHLNQRGAWSIGRDHLLPILRTAVAAGTVFNTDPATANLLGAGFAKMQGTSGAKIGNPAPTGSLASGFQVQNLRNTSAILCSKEVITGDMEAQVLDFTPTDSSTASFGQAAIALPPVAIPSPGAGKWYSTAVRVETSGSGALSGLRMTSQLRTAGSSSTAHAIAIALSTFSPDLATSIPGDRAYWVRSKPFQAPAGVVCDQLQWSIDIYYPKTSTPLRVKLSRPMLREIADPRPGWGY